MDNILEKIISEQAYYNLSIMPFNYKAIVKNEEILKQVQTIKDTPEGDNREEEKDKLLKLIYTELYKQNFKSEEIKEYFSKAILTNKYKTYLGMAFKFSIEYNIDEDVYITTFIHLAQFFISDICYEYIWKLENQ